jgi:hypothetical protein
MGDMSPLGRFILVALLWGVRFAAIAFAASIALVIWQKGFSQGAPGFVRQDYVFLAVLTTLFIAALFFAGSVKRELR